MNSPCSGQCMEKCIHVAFIVHALLTVPVLAGFFCNFICEETLPSHLKSLSCGMSLELMLNVDHMLQLAVNSII